VCWGFICSRGRPFSASSRTGSRWVHEAADPNWAADSRQPSDFVTHEPRVDIRPKLTRRVRRLWDGSDRAGVETERRAGVPERGQSPRS
jgi:hypothetical protein